MTARTYVRPLALLGAVALLAGPLAAGADAAPKRKPPAPVVTAKPPSPTNVRSATFSFSNTQAGVTYECSLDGSAYAACTSPKTYAGPLGGGTHQFKVRALAAGVASGATNASWVVDLTPPAAPSLSGVPSPSPTTATSASLTFTTGETAATFVCSVDGAALSFCTSPRSLSGLADGPHTFAVAVRDQAGNVGATANGAWTVDTTPPPPPVITTGPADVTNQTAAAFSVSSPDPAATLRCSLDGAAMAACPEPIAYAGLGAGVHTFDVTAADALGNAATPAHYAWEVDLTAPTPPQILTGPAARTKDTVGGFTFNGFDAVSLLCSLDGADYAGCTTAYDTPALADGDHTLLVKGVDAATNESGATPWHWTVDNAPPPAAVVTGPAALTNATSATFAITDTEPLVTFTCALDGALATPCQSGVTYSSLADGAHGLVVTASDSLGNSVASAPYDWTVDTAGPTGSATFPASIIAPVAVTFSEAVRGVSGSSLALRVSGSTANVASSLACTSAAATVVSCATGAVKNVVLRPSSPLVPGERYAVVANPAGASTIADGAGNALASTSSPFRAATSLQENTPAAKYAWRVVSSASAYGGSYRTEHLAGAAVSYPFVGTSVTWYTVRGRSQGVADMYVDGVKKATVNNYASATSYKVARSVTGLADTKHVLKVVVRGVKGSASGTGTYVVVDAVKAGTTLTSSPVLAQAWRRMGVTAASGGALAVADLAGQEVSMVFRGTSVAWYTSTGRNRGIVKVYVDGVLKATVDNYAAATAYGVRRVVSGLSDARHTLRVVVTGTHRASATGNLLAIDRFAIT